jgi:hypothetical protein
MIRVEQLGGVRVRRAGISLRSLSGLMILWWDLVEVNSVFVCVCVCVCLTSSREGLPSDAIPITGRIHPSQRL